MKRFIKILLLLVLGLVLALILLPIFFKAELMEAVKTEINKTVNAEVDFADLDISLFKTFPKISLQLEDLSITGVDAFEGQNLMRSKNIYLSTDFKSLIKSSEGINIYKIILDEPVVDLVVNESGSANYDISKSTSTASSDDSFFGNIQSYEVIDGALSFSDHVGKMYMSLEELNHKGKGDFQDIQFDLETETTIEKVSFKSDGINYLKNARATGDIDLGIDLDKQSYTFKENLMSLNDLSLSFTGVIKLLNEGFDLDLYFKAPNNKVSSLFSLVPNVYTADYSELTSEGSSTIKGNVKGIYNSVKPLYPSFSIGVDVKDGLIKYPDLPMPIKEILLDLNIKSNRSDLSDLAVLIPQFNFDLDGDKVEGKLNITNAMANAGIDGLLKGQLDLKKLAKAFPMDEYQINSGIIDADFSIKTDQNAILNKEYENIGFQGDLSAANLDVTAEGMAIKINKIDAALSPKNIDATVSNANIGNSDFNGNLSVKDPLLTLTEEGEATAVIDIKSNVLDVDELMAFGGEETPTAIDTISNELPFQGINLEGSYSAKKVKYEDYDIGDIDGLVSYANDKLDITSAKMKLDGKSISMNGYLDKPMGFMYNEQIISGDLYIEAEEINANKYLSETDNSEEIEGIISVPQSIDIDIYPKIKTLIYDNYTLTNTSGKINIENGVASLIGGETKLFNGVVNFDGAYNTSEVGKALFDFKYDMSDINFTKMFEESETFRILAPIAKYIDGIFNSNLIVSGPIGNDMMPDLTKLTASGFLETVKGKVNGFEPLSKVGNVLGINSIGNLDIKDSKNWFEVKDGRVILKDHDYAFDDMSFTVGGNHGIDQSIDYQIKAVIPRDKLKQANLGKTLEMGMSEIEKAATSRGVDISLGENIFMDIYLTGTLMKPKVKIIPVGAGGKTLKDVVKDEFNKQTEILKDTIQQELEKRTEVLKDTITKAIESRVDSVKIKLQEEADKKKDEVKDAMKDKIKEKIDSSAAGTVIDSLENKLGDKVGDIIGDTGSTEIDSLKDKLKGWNPFKKKKN